MLVSCRQKLRVNGIASLQVNPAHAPASPDAKLLVVTVALISRAADRGGIIMHLSSRVKCANGSCDSLCGRGMMVRKTDF